MSQNQQSRQPKGKREGGQFADSKNSEATVELPSPFDTSNQIEQLRRDIEDSKAKLSSLIENDEIGNDEEIERLNIIAELQDDLISLQAQRITELALPISEEGLRELVGRAVEQTEDIKSLRQQIGELERTAPSRPVIDCAYAVDEAIDVLTRWEAGSGADPTDVLIGLMETRAELFNLAESKNPDVVAAWHGCESRIRDFEAGNESISDEEFDKLRDEREALFVDIVRMSLAKSNETRAEVVAGISWTKSDAEAMAVSLSDEEWSRVTERFATFIENGALGVWLRDGLMSLMDDPEGEVG
jgi:hypothetical protein